MKLPNIDSLIILQSGDSLEKLLLSFQSKEQNICGAFTLVIHFSSGKDLMPRYSVMTSPGFWSFPLFSFWSAEFYFRWLTDVSWREQNPTDKLSERAHQVMMQKWNWNGETWTVSQQNAEIIDSLYYARNIQAAILPKTGMITRNFKGSIWNFYKPKDIVRRFYFSENLTTVILAIADCTGHGVAGAFMSMVFFPSASNHRTETSDGTCPDSGSIEWWNCWSTGNKKKVGILHAGNGHCFVLYRSCYEGT